MIIGALVAYIFAREVFFLYTTNKLVNKIMAKNYYDYQQAQNVGRVDRPAPGFSGDQGEPEDLSALTGIG